MAQTSLLELVRLNEALKQREAGRRASMTMRPRGGASAGRAAFDTAFASDAKDAASDRSDAASASTSALAAVARAASRLKSKAGKTWKSRYFLRMQPPDDDRPPVGLPVREALVQTFNERRDRTCWEFLMYAVFVLVFCLVITRLNDTAITQSANGAVYDAFLDEAMWQPDASPAAIASGDSSALAAYLDPISYKKTFFDISDLPELQQWLLTVFREAFYEDAWYNGQKLSTNELGYVRRSLRIVGGARIWQARVRNDSCSSEQVESSAYKARFAPPGGGCFGDFTLDNADTSPFGPSSNPAKYKYSSSVGTTVEGLSGFGVTDYGSGGYVVFLPTDRANGTKLLDELLRDRFVDKQTRMLTIDFNLFGSDIGYLTTARFTVEMLPTGAVLPSFRLYSVKMLLYDTTIDRIRGIGEAFVVGLTVYYLVKELKELRRSRPMLKYFTQVGNAFDLSLQILMCACMGFWLLQITNPTRNSFSANEVCTATGPPIPNAYGAATCYVDMFGLSRNFQYAMTTAGVLGLCMVMKFFRYFALSRRMNALWLTLSNAAVSLAGFAVGFTVVVAGFSFLAQHTFGSGISGLHRFDSAFATLVRYPLGDFDYSSLRQARPDIAPLFFFAYTIIVALVSMNMVVAIITAAFEDVSKGLKSEEKWKHVTTSYWLHILHKSRRPVLLVFLLFRYMCGRRTARFLCCCGICIAEKRNPFADAARGAGVSVNGATGSLNSAAANGLRSSSFGGGTGSDTSSRSIRLNPLHPPGGEGVDPVEAELNSLTAEAVFVDLAQKFIRRAERQSAHSDLLAYFEEIYRTAGAGKNVFIGLNELCALCRDPDVPLDPFCKVGHRWRSLGAFVVSKAQQAEAMGFQATAANGKCSCAGVKRALCCGRGASADAAGVSISALDDLEIAMSAGRVRGTAGAAAGAAAGDAAAGSAAARNAWTSNPLRDGSGEGSGQGATDGSAAGGDGAGGASPYDPEVIKAVYKPKCIAWRMVQAYNAYKDVILLGPSERHAFMSEHMTAGGAEDEEDGDHTDVDDATAAKTRSALAREPGTRGSWQVIKINRNSTRQRRYLSIREEGFGNFVVYNHSLKGSLKRRFRISQVMQVEASIPNPRLCVVHIEAEAGVEASDPLARLACTADTLYTCQFGTVEERDSFCNALIRARERCLKMQLGLVDAPSGHGSSDAGPAGASNSVGSRLVAAFARARAAGGAGGRSEEKAGGGDGRSDHEVTSPGGGAGDSDDDDGDKAVTFRRGTVLPHGLPEQPASGFLQKAVAGARQRRATRLASKVQPPGGLLGRASGMGPIGMGMGVASGGMPAGAVPFGGPPGIAMVPLPGAAAAASTRRLAAESESRSRDAAIGLADDPPSATVAGAATSEAASASTWTDESGTTWFWSDGCWRLPDGRAWGADAAAASEPVSEEGWG